MTDQETNGSAKKFEMICGVTIAVFAAILAITDLFGGKYGDDEIMATNEKASAYMWYQSKSIKETVVEGQVQLLEALASAGALDSKQEPAIRKHMADLTSNIEKYKKEKNEILQGSKVVGEENWVQELDGKKGQVIGALDWEKNAEVLSRVGDRLDIATLFLQLSLVMGAVSLVLNSTRSQKLFFWVMVGLGLLGTGISISGFLIL